MRAHARFRAIGADHQSRRELGAALEPDRGVIFVKLERGPTRWAMHAQVLPARSFLQRMVEAAVLDDERKLAQSRVVGAELDAGARIVAIHAHALDPGDPLRRQPLPRAAAFEKCSGSGTQRVDAAVPVGSGGGRCRRLRLDQRLRQSTAGKRAREGEPDEPAANDYNIE